MTLELTPVGIACNISCKYCYQEPMRKAGNIVPPNKNIDKMLAATDQRFTVFGGEALLTPIDELEKIFEYGFKNFGGSDIQTNGILITEKHIELFKKYRVGIGISVDGPWPLTSCRMNVGESYAVTKNINDLIEAGIIPAFIVTLHKENAVGDKLKTICSWFERLANRGVWYVNLHPLEDDNNTNLVLTSDELFTALVEIKKVERIKFTLFDAITDLLQGNDKEADCTWHGCDPYTTPAVHGVDRDGSITNCGRVHKDGVGYRKADEAGDERLLALYNTPQEFGGCQGCRFFVMCKGYCPGTGIDGDWRNRTTHCETIKRLFEVEEEKLIAKGIVPISQRGDLKDIECALLNRRDIVNRPHGDVPHGDVEHGDHTDAPAVVEVENTGSSCGCEQTCGGHRA